MEGMFPAAIEGGDFSDLNGRFDGFLYTDVADFAKALTSGYGTDAAAFTQGRALQFESLEPSLLATIQEKGKHFPLFDRLEKSNATSVVDQFTIKDAVGGFPGSATNDETGTIEEQTGTYRRKTAQVKYLMTMRRVSAVQRATQAQVEAMSVENEDAILELLSTAEHLFYYGDAAAAPTEFDGIRKTLETDATSDHIYDLAGGTITPEAQEFIDSAAFISDFGQFGMLTDAWMSNLVKSDLDKKLDPAHRVSLTDKPNSIRLGTPVKGITTSWGDIATHSDIFVREGGLPFSERGGVFASVVSAGVCDAPAGVAAANAGATAGSKFLTAHAGNYYYAAEGGNKKGRSALVKSGQVAVSAGDAVTVTITNASSGNGSETYFMIYRNKRNGSNANTDFREMRRVAKTSGATTVFTDKNEWVPGASEIFLLNMEAGARAITMRRLLPLTRFALYPTNSATYPWAQLLFLYLRIAKPKQHRIIKNVVPSGSTFKPF